MKKKILAIATTIILTIGAVTAAYGRENINLSNFGYRGSMMYQNNRSNTGTYNNSTYNSMIDLMRQNGFEEGAKAMESRDYNAMNSFMNKLNNEQYNQMIQIMKDNGYGGMARMMSSVSREGMLNIHNSMMGR